MKRQSFSAQICPLPTPLTQIKMHVRKEVPLCMGDGGEVRLCVCCKSYFPPPFKQKVEYMCNVIRSLIFLFLYYITLIYNIYINFCLV